MNDIDAKTERLRKRLLRICSEIRKAEYAVLHSQSASTLSDSQLRTEVEGASHLLMQAAEQAERILG